MFKQPVQFFNAELLGFSSCVESVSCIQVFCRMGPAILAVQHLSYTSVVDSHGNNSLCNDRGVHVQVKDHIQTINLAPIDTYFMLNCFNNTSGPGFLHRAPS